VGIGVIGVTQSAFLEQADPLGSPAILGLNDVQKTDFAKGGESFSANFQLALTDATQKKIAVAGLSRAGHGVCGLSLNMLDRTVDLPAQPNVNAILRGDVLPVDRLNTSVAPDTEKPQAAAGVIGIAMKGPGLRGVSLTDRGAIFQSATYAAEKEADSRLGVAPPPVAQIRLVPHANLQADQSVGVQEPPLPAEGKMGDLLALAVIDSNRQLRADLWFVSAKITIRVVPCGGNLPFPIQLLVRNPNTPFILWSPYDFQRSCGNALSACLVAGFRCSWE
jgi:hypothetical protein